MAARAPCHGNEIVKNWDNQSFLCYEKFVLWNTLCQMHARYISWEIFSKAGTEWVKQRLHPVPCLSGIGTGHSNASPRPWTGIPSPSNLGLPNPSCRHLSLKVVRITMFPIEERSGNDWREYLGELGTESQIETTLARVVNKLPSWIKTW